jgi:hypothetical protein
VEVDVGVGEGVAEGIEVRVTVASGVTIACGAEHEMKIKEIIETMKVGLFMITSARKQAAFHYIRR